jgi:hypothetical protein
MKRVLLAWFIVPSCLAFAQAYGSDPTDIFGIYWSRTDSDSYYDNQFDGVFVVTKRWVVAATETPSVAEPMLMAYGCFKNKEQLCQVLERLEVNGTTFEPKEFKGTTYYNAKRPFQAEDTQLSWRIQGQGLAVTEENLAIVFPPPYDLTVPEGFSLGTVTLTATPIGDVPVEATGGYAGMSLAPSAEQSSTTLVSFQRQVPEELVMDFEKDYVEGLEEFGWASGDKSGYAFVTACNDVVKTYTTENGDKKLVFRACTQTIKNVSFTVE